MDYDGKSFTGEFGMEISHGEENQLETRKASFSEEYKKNKHVYVEQFLRCSGSEQIDLVRTLMQSMSHFQLGAIDHTLQPLLQRDFITQLATEGLPDLAKCILGYLDSKSLRNAEMVCRGWHDVVHDGMLWKAYVENQVKKKSIWRGLAERRGWLKYLFRGCKEEGPRPDSFFRGLCPAVHQDIAKIDSNWRNGRCAISRINCESEQSKGVYCLQYDDDKIVSGLRDNTIKIWDRKTLECKRTLTGHTGSVLCLQYNENVIITGSSDSTVRVWDPEKGEQINTLMHHSEAVLHLRYYNGVMVTCSKDRTIVVWEMTKPYGLAEIKFQKVLVGHRAAVNVVDFDEKYIVSASGDRTIKVWTADTGEFVRTLQGHRRGIACLQYRENIVVSGSSDNTIRIWDIEHGTSLRTLEGHDELVRCIRFDDKRIVSGAYDGKIKIWDLKKALDPRIPSNNLCIQTLEKHSGRVFRLQFDEFQIISSSHDDTILIWDFLNAEKDGENGDTNEVANDDGMAEDEDDGQQLQVVELHEAPMNIEPEMANGFRLRRNDVGRNHRGRGNRPRIANANMILEQMQIQNMQNLPDLAALQRQLVADRGQLPDNNEAPPGEDFGDPMDEDVA